MADHITKIDGPEPSPFVNLVEFDALAQSIAARLNCATSLISVVEEETLHVMGHSDRDALPERRKVALRDTVCARTMAQGAPLRLSDVRGDAGLRAVATVEALDIGAYLGVPLRGAGGRVVGALCAISHAPRIWQQQEEDYLSAVAAIAESQIERHVLRYEQVALSAALAENDAILTTLAETDGRALTVHNAAGELLFANAALRTDLNLSYQELLALPNAALSLVRRGASSGAIEVDLPGRPVNALRVELSHPRNGLTLGQWRRVNPE